MHTVVARFHHVARKLAEIEDDLVGRGAVDAHITGFTVAMTFDAESHREASEAAKRILESAGATRIKITKHRPKAARYVPK